MLAFVLKYLVFLLVGVVGGVINTLAGGASVFILAVLLFYDMPVALANGTSRLGLLVQHAAGAYTFHRSGLFNIKEGLPYIYPSVAGAVAGAFLAALMPPLLLEIIIVGGMAYMVVPMLKKKKPAKAAMLGAAKNRGKQLLKFVVFLGIGLYGGLAGTALVLVLALTQIARFTLIKATAVKMAITFLFNIPAFAIFIYYGLVDWEVAVWLTVGQLAGTWFAARYLINRKGIDVWINRLLVAMVLITIVQVPDWAALFSYFVP